MNLTISKYNLIKINLIIFLLSFIYLYYIDINKTPKIVNLCSINRNLLGKTIETNGKINKIKILSNNNLINNLINDINNTLNNNSNKYSNKYSNLKTTPILININTNINLNNNENYNENNYYNNYNTKYNRKLEKQNQTNKNCSLDMIIFNSNKELINKLKKLLKNKNLIYNSNSKYLKNNSNRIESSSIKIYNNSTYNKKINFIGKVTLYNNKIELILKKIIIN